MKIVYGKNSLKYIPARNIVTGWLSDGKTGLL